MANHIQLIPVKLKRESPRKKPAISNQKINPQTQLTRGLVGAWMLDEGGGTKVFDLIKNNHGSITGATWANSANGRHLDFTGGSANLVDIGTFAVPGDEITISCWIFIDSFAVGSRDDRFISKADGTATANHDFMLGMTNSGADPVLRARFARQTDTALSDLIIPTGRWVHVAAIYWFNGVQNVARCFVNGVPQTTDVAFGVGSVPFASNTNPVYIGNQPTSTSSAPDGKIREVLIWNRALSNQEIKNYYNHPYSVFETPQLMAGVANPIEASSDTTNRQNQQGVANIRNNVTNSISGLSRIQVENSSHQSGQSRIEKQNFGYINGISRIEKVLTGNINGLGRVEKQFTSSISGVAKIQTAGNGVTLSDDFERASANNLGANWTDVAGGFEIVNNSDARGETLEFGKNLAIHVTPTNTVNQYVRLQAHTVNNAFPGVAFRYVDTSSPHYLVDWDTNDLYWTYYPDVASNSGDPGTRNIINGGGNISFTSGNAMGLTIKGTGAATRLRVWYNVTALAPDIGGETWDGNAPDINQLIDGGNTADTGKGIGICSFWATASGETTIERWDAGDIPTTASDTTNTQNIQGRASVLNNRTNSINGVARIDKAFSSSINGQSRIEKQNTQSINGLGRIEITNSQNQSGKGRVEITSNNSISGRSRIEVGQTNLHTGKARIEINNSNSESGKGRIQITNSTNLQGLACVQITQTNSITGVTRIQVTNTSSETGKSRIECQFISNQSGQSRIQIAQNTSISGVTRVQITNSTSETGKARIEATNNNSINGITRIQNTLSSNINGVAKIFVEGANNVNTQSITGVAKIVCSYIECSCGGFECPAGDYAISGVARIQRTETSSISGLGRVQVTNSNSLNGKARIQITSSTSISGISRIDKSSSNQINGVCRVERNNTGSQNGIARIQVTNNSSISGVGRINQHNTQSISGVARLNAAFYTQNIQGTARIFVPGAFVAYSQIISGKASILNSANNSISGKSRIEFDRSQNETGVARIQIGNTLNLDAISRIQKVLSDSINGKARLEVTSAGNLSGVARIHFATTSSILGQATIRKSLSDSILGKGRIETSTISSETGKSFIQKVLSQNINGQANLRNQMAASVNGLARVRTIAGSERAIYVRSELDGTTSVENKQSSVTISDGRSKATVNTGRNKFTKT